MSTDNLGTYHLSTRSAHASYTDLRPSKDDSELYSAPRRARLSNTSLDPFRSFPFLDTSPTDVQLPYSYPSTPAPYKHIREPVYTQDRPRTNWWTRFRLPKTDEWDWATAKWPLVLSAFLLVDVVYLLIAVFSYRSETLLEGNGHFSGNAHRPLGIAISGLIGPGSDQSKAHNDGLRILLSAAVLVPTALLTWLVKRVHLLRAREGTTSNKNLETPTWTCHVSYQNQINYASSGLLFLVVVLTHTAGSLVFCESITAGGFARAKKGSGQAGVHAYSSVIYCPLAMIIHSSGLLIMAIWSLRLCSTLQRTEGMTLRRQLGPGRPSPYAQGSNPSITISEALSRPKHIKSDSASSIEETMSILYEDKLTRPQTRTPGRFGELAFVYPPEPGSAKRQPLYRHSAQLLSVAAIAAFLCMAIALSVSLAQAATSDDRFSIKASLGQLVHAAHPVYLRFPLHFAPVASLWLTILLLGLFFALLELFQHGIEVVLYRRWWEMLWRSRRSGRVYGGIPVEGLRSRRWHFVVLAMLSAVELWIMSNAVVVASYRPDPAVPTKDYSMGVWPIPGWCFLLALVMAVHATTAGVLVWRTRGSDDMTTWGDKAAWRKSGVMHVERGWRWGAVVQPKAEEALPGTLGWGERAADPVPGMYVWVDG